MRCPTCWATERAIKMTDIKVFEGISSVAFSEKLGGNTSTCDIFTRIGEGGIDVDMISLELTANDTISTGFTVSDEDLPRLLPLIRSKDITTPIVNCGNVKFVIKSEEMVDHPGFAAKIFAELKTVDCVPLMVTTGIDEISILVRDSDSTDVGRVLNVIFPE